VGLYRTEDAADRRAVRAAGTLDETRITHGGPGAKRKSQSPGGPSRLSNRIHLHDSRENQCLRLSNPFQGRSCLLPG